jgi:tRNA (guanine-N7-)-methyltransferase
MTKVTHSHEKFYGRRKGQKLSQRKLRLLDEVLPRVQITLGDETFDPTTLFENPPKEIWLEVGFGKGEHLAARAAANPDVGFIGCEPFLNGIAGLVTKIHEQNLKNVRIFPDDARLVLDKLPNDSLSRFFLIHPDPWPKARHANRRFLSQVNLDRIARVLKKGGEFFVSTDHSVYKTWVMLQMQNRQDFRWTAEKAAHWQTPPKDWPGTRYEAKAQAEDIDCAYFSFIRV